MPVPPAVDRISLRLTGDPVIDVAGRRRALEPRAAALLALVAVEGEVPRERAAALLWPTSSDARGALRQQLARFRRQIGVDLIDGAASLRLAPGVAVDVSADGDAAASLLGDLRFHDEPAFDAWLVQQRARRDSPPPASAEVSATPVAALPATLLRPPHLIGRQTEHEALAAAWAGGRAALVLGEAGLGKSRLLEQFAAGRSVIAVPARPGDAGVPYGTLARLLRAVLARGRVDLVEPQRLELARLLPELAPGAAPLAQTGRLAVMNAVEQLLRAVRIEGQPLQGVIVDDLHFADVATLELLPALVSALAATVRFGFAQRPGEGDAAAATLRGALEEAGLLSTILLAPLRADDLAALVASLQIEALDAPRLAQALARHTGGNPLFALETVKQGLLTGQLRSGDLPQPGTVRALIERRLRQLPAQALALARVAAIAGPDFSASLAEQALGQRAIGLADAWQTLSDAQVLSDTAFAHDLVAEAVLRSVPASVGRELHQRIAAWLPAQGGEPARIAQHWLAGGDVAAALPWLHRAAEVARARLRPREAADCLQQALDIETEHASPAQAFDTLTRLLKLRLLVDQDGSLLTLIDRMDMLAMTASQRIAAGLQRAEFRMHRGDDLADGQAAAERAAVLAEQSGAGEALIEARLTAAVLQAMRGDYASAAGAVDPLLDALPAVADTQARCNLLGKAAYVLARAGRTQEGGALFDEAARQAHADPQVQLVALANAAQARLQLNDPEGALARLQRSDALRAAHDGLRGSGHANAWMTAWALQLLGRYAEALALFDGMIEEIGARSPGKLAAVFVDRARLWLELGQPARAHQDRERARAALRRPDHAGLRLLDLRLAAAGLLPPPPADEVPMAHIVMVQARLLASSLVPDGVRVAQVEQALHEAQRCGYRGLEASALARRARLRASAGEQDAAVDDARAAVRLAEGRNTDDLTFPDLALHGAAVLQGAGHAAEAAVLLGSAVDWLARAAAPLPLPLQSSLRERNPVHRLLLERARS